MAHVLLPIAWAVPGESVPAILFAASHNPSHKVGRIQSYGIEPAGPVSEYIQVNGLAPDPMDTPGSHLKSRELQASGGLNPPPSTEWDSNPRAVALRTFRGPDFGSILRDPCSNRDAEATSSDTSGFPPKIHIAHIVDTMFDTMVCLQLVRQFTHQDLQTALGKFVLRHAGFFE